MKRELSTIQKRGRLNKVYECEVPVGEVPYIYLISREMEPSVGTAPEKIVESIQFQRGPREEQYSLHGVISSDLLEVVRAQLSHFQRGELATKENERAIIHVEEALMWLSKRAEDRIERSVLGTNEK